MPYRTGATQCVVRLIPLRRLSAATLAQCATLRREAGRCWTDLVAAHQAGRAEGRWLSVRDLEQLAAAGGPGGAVCPTQPDPPGACPETRRQPPIRDRIAQGGSHPGRDHDCLSVSPHTLQTVAWKDQALQVQAGSGHLRLSNGAKRAPLLLPLPEEYHYADIRRAELTWRADHYELCLTLDTGQALPAPRTPAEGEVVAGVDLGEVHIAAITVTTGHALVLSGRFLRACKQGRNRVHSILQEKLSRCQRDSKRWRRLSKRRAEISAKVYRQQREVLH
ncbi:MAG: transposase [Ktedonobacterales bacterium]